MTIWTELVRDGATAADAVVCYFIIEVADGAVSADAPPVTTAAAIIADGATASDSAVPQIGLHQAVADGAEISDALSTGLTLAVSDGANASDAATYSVDSFVSDGATASDAATNLLVQTQAVSDAASATDAAGQGFSYAVSDGATTTDGLAGVAIDLAISDSATASDAAVATRHTTETAADAASATDATSAHLVATNTVSDGARASDRPLFDASTALWNNARTLAAARWTGLPFNSYVIHEGALLAAGQAGIAAFGNDSDAGALVVATVKGDLVDFGSPSRKVYDGAYVAALAAGNLQLRVATENGAWSYLEASSPGKLSNVFFQLGRGLFSRYARFQLSNPDGARFTVRDARVNVGVTDRLR